MAFLSGGDVALDVSLLKPSQLSWHHSWFQPSCHSWPVSTWVSLPKASSLVPCIIVVVPIILGVLFTPIFGKENRYTSSKVMPLISQAAILLIVGAVVSANHANIFTAATATCHSSRYAPDTLWLCPWFWIFKNPWFEELYNKKPLPSKSDARLKVLGQPLPWNISCRKLLSINYLWYFNNISGSILSSWWKNHLKNN